MKIHTKIFLVLLLCTVIAGHAWPDVVVPLESVTSYVNIRLAPDADSEVIGRLHRGAQLPLVRSLDGWHEVELKGGGAGYISADWAIVIRDKQETSESTGDEAADADDELVAPSSTATEEPLPEPVTDETPEDEPTADEPIVQAPVADQPAADEPAADEPATDEPAVETPVADEPAPIELPVDEPPVIEPPVDEPRVDEVPAAAVPVPVAAMEGSVDQLVKFITPTNGGNSQIFDNGRNVGIGTTEPKHKLEVNGNISINEQSSNVAGLLITQSSGETGYIMHNRASTLTIGAGSIDRITISRDGNVGFGVNRPSRPLEMASGAHVTPGGVWTNSSSIEKKENIRELGPEDALQALAQLEPVRFNYKEDESEEYVGFIAEDVPDLVATADRTGLAAMDIVAVLTSVVQEQQKRIEALEARLEGRSSSD